MSGSGAAWKFFCSQEIFLYFAGNFFVYNVFCFGTSNNIVKVTFQNCYRVDLECKDMRTQIRLQYIL